MNAVAPVDQPIHRWYRFVLSFPPHLVAHYLAKFGIQTGNTVLDPFCGAGTTLVECKKRKIESVGVEAMPIMKFASEVKVDWTETKRGLLDGVDEVCETISQYSDHTIMGTHKTFSPEEEELLIRNSVSTQPLHKLLILRECISSSSKISRHTKKYLLLALAKTAVKDASNLHFGPEVGVKHIQTDVDVLGKWQNNVIEMAGDLDQHKAHADINAIVKLSDSRNISDSVIDKSIDFVFTSPPYPNEKDYSRTTRLESVLLGFMHDRNQLRATKQNLLRSNTRNVYVADTDDRSTTLPDRVVSLAQQIEKKRIELGKNSGFEKNYHRVASLYFGGMANHLRSLQSCLRPGAILAYVVGDQASFFRIHIQTGQILAEIAESLQYRILDIDLFRTRKATVTRQELREEVVLFQWLGESG